MMFSASEIFPRHLRTWAQLGTVALSTAVLVACGGGGSSDNGSSAASGNFSVGAIQGWGSVVVNGVHFDQSGASVTDDDDNSVDDSALKLGMEVEVESERVRSSGDTKASHIGFGSSLVGPVDEAPGATSLKVLGQTVNVTDTTVFDSSITGGLAGIKKDDIVNVHGLFDKTTGVTTATRIELKPNAAFYRLRGVVADLKTTEKTLTIGGQLVSIASAEKLPGDLANGQVVRAKLKTTKDASGAWVAVRIKSAEHKMRERENEGFEVEGSVTAFTDSKNFSVGDVVVDASNAKFEPNADAVKLGARIEVEGTVTNGVLVATKVEVKGLKGGNGGGNNDGSFEFRGVPSAVTDTSITLRGETILLDANTQYLKGTKADLSTTSLVEVKAKLDADKKLVATLVRFEK